MGYWSVSISNKVVLILDGFSHWTGRCLSWLALLMAALVFALVVLRNVFSMGSIAAQELVVYFHAVLLMLAFGYTLKEGGHIRVDVLYRNFSSLNQAWINALGSCFLLIPFSLFLLFISLPSAETSWKIKEASSNTGGIPAVFLLKSIVPISGFLLFLQALSELLKSLLILSYSSSDASDKTQLKQ